MNEIIARVQGIQNHQNLNIVNFSCKEYLLKMMSLDLTQDIQTGSEVVLTCKPTAIAIAKNLEGEVSLSNQLAVKILSIETGTLLCVLKLQFDEFTLESIITADSFTQMCLKTGDRVTALIKSSDLSLKKVLL